MMMVYLIITNFIKNQRRFDHLQFANNPRGHRRHSKVKERVLLRIVGPIIVRFVLSCQYKRISTMLTVLHRMCPYESWKMACHAALRSSQSSQSSQSSLKSTSLARKSCQFAGAFGKLMRRCRSWKLGLSLSLSPNPNLCSAFVPWTSMSWMNFSWVAYTSESQVRIPTSYCSSRKVFVTRLGLLEVLIC